MRKEFGTYLFRGMNSATAPHLLEDGELALAANCDFDVEYGSIKPFATADTSISLPGVTTRGAAVMEDDGTLIYKYDQTVVHDETTALVTGNSNYPFFYPVNERTYMVDTDINWLFDGTSYRKHGALIPDKTNTGFYEQSGATSNGSITAATKANPCLITSTGHGLATGARIWIKNVVGMEELNYRHYTITLDTGDPTNKFSLDDVDSSNYNTYTSSGNWYENTCGWGLGGGETRSYGVSYVVEMPNGDTVESDLFLIGTGETAEVDADADALEATPGASTDRVRVWYRKIMDTDLGWDGSTGYTTPTSVAGYLVGTNINVHVRIYRNKSGGSNYYLLEEMSHSDSYETGVSYYGGVYDTKLDRNLGAQYGSGDAINSHGLPPVASVLTSAGDRIYCDDEDNTGRLYFSGPWQPDYFPPLNYIEVEGDITALGVYGDSVMIFTAGRLWRYSRSNGVPFREEIDVPEGTSDPRSVVTTPYGLVYAGERGLYLYRGTTPERISTPWQDLFDAAPGPWQCCFVDNRLYAFNGSATSYVATFLAGEIRWATVSTPGSWVFGRRSDGAPYYMTSNAILQLYEGSGNTSIRIDTKQWALWRGGGAPIEPSRAELLWVDCETAGSGITITLLYPGGSEVLATNETTTSRQLLRYQPTDNRPRQGYQLRIDGNVEGLYGVGMILYGGG